MPGHYPTPPPPPRRRPSPPKQGRSPLPPKQRSKDPDFWESKQGDGSAGTYKKKPVPGGSKTKRTYTPEKD